MTAVIHQLVQQHGTDSQRERFDANRLPDKELRAILCAVLFKPLDGFARFRRLEPHDLKHRNDCPGTSEAVASFKVEDDYQGPVTDAQWATWKMLNAAFREELQPSALVSKIGVISIKMRWHLAECVSCEAQKQRPSAMVTIRFSGLVLSREYAL